LKQLALSAVQEVMGSPATVPLEIEVGMRVSRASNGEEDG
jgi:hypothetical protein